MKNTLSLFSAFLTCCFLCMACSDDRNSSENDSTSIESVLTSDYKIYVCDAGNFSDPPWKIVQYDHDGKNPVTYINTNLDWPQDIVFLEDQNIVLISNLNSGEINRYNIETGDFVNVFAEDIGGPTRMKIGPDGLIYVLQWNGNGKVLRYDLDGNFQDEFTETGIDQAIGLDWDSSGNLYVASFKDRNVVRFDVEGNELGVFAEENLSGPTNVWFDSNGQLFVNDWRAGTIQLYDSQGQFVETFATGLSEVEGVSVISDGSMLIGNGGTGSVKLITAEGEVSGDLIEPRSGGLNQPNAVVLRKIN